MYKIFLLIALALTPATVLAGPPESTSLKISLTIVDPEEAPVTNFIPRATNRTPEGEYVPQAVACNHRHNKCIDTNGKEIGSIDEVRRWLPEVNVNDVDHGRLACDRVCYDSTGRIVGSFPRRR